MTKIIHSEMVRVLAKPGAAILETLTPKKVEMWHMASCIPGEAGELFDAIQHGDVENVREELGDNYFYVTGLAQAAGIDESEYTVEGVGYSDLALPGAAGEVFDAVKKHVIYNKEFDRANLIYRLSVYLAVLKSIGDQYEITVENAKEQNIEKLSERYKGLVYSDQAAQDRADKQPLDGLQDRVNEASPE